MSGLFVVELAEKNILKLKKTPFELNLHDCAYNSIDYHENDYYEVVSSLIIFPMNFQDIKNLVC